MLVPVATESMMRPGTRRAVEAGGRRLLLVAENDGYHALADECPHHGVPLSDGTIRDGAVRCPWHDWAFDLRTGQCRHNPSVVPTYPVTVVDGRVCVDVPEPAAPGTHGSPHRQDAGFVTRS